MVAARQDALASPPGGPDCDHSSKRPLPSSPSASLALDESSSLFSGRLRWLLKELQQEWNELERRLEEMSHEIETIAKHNEVSLTLMEIPGFGPLVSTALTTAVCNGAMFRKARDLAAWLGLVPRQHSTGGKTKLLGISKRGNEYLPRMFLHGARSVVMHMERKESALALGSLSSRNGHTGMLRLSPLPLKWRASIRLCRTSIRKCTGCLID